MSNKHDDLYMADENNQFIMAEGIANGIDKYFEIQNQDKNEEEK